MDLDIIAFLKNRRSIREHLPKKVPDKILHSVLEVARWAPLAHNAQPWRFVVIKGSIMKRKLAEAMACRWEKDLAKNGVSEKDRPHPLPRKPFKEIVHLNGW